MRRVGENNLTLKSQVGNNENFHVNDPSAGSPTETLLRLLLPLNNMVYSTSRSKI